MGLTFSAVTTPADRVAAELLAVPIAKTGSGRILGPGADVVDAALDGGLEAFLDETGFEANLGETLSVPTSGKLKAKAAVLVGVGEIDKLTLDGLRRAGAAVARRAQGHIGRNHARERRAGSSRRRRRAGGGRGDGARRIPIPRVQARRQTHEALEGEHHR